MPRKKHATEKAQALTKGKCRIHSEAAFAMRSRAAPIRHLPA